MPLIVNETVLLIPFAVLTDILDVPGVAPEEMENVAVTCVGLTTFTFETEIPGLLGITARPDAKLKPLRFTPTVAPTLPLFGLTPVRYGAAERMVEELVGLAPE